MELKVKKLVETAALPIRSHDTDAGLDLTCTSITTTINECGQLMLVYHTGLSIEIPDGYVGLLFPRSSIYKKSLRQTNSVGVVDAGYRGEVTVIMQSTTDVIPSVYKEGERFCQLVIMKLPDIEVVETTELSESDRGDAGFGSTDIKEVSAPNDTQTDESNATEEAAEPTIGSEQV